MEKLFCHKCETDVEPLTELKSNQNTARCPNCNTFLKNIPYQKPMLYAGKYKNIPIDEISDLGYLKWAAEKMTSLQGRVKTAISNRIAQLEYEAK